MDYGKAKAGGRTADDICGYGLCSTYEGEAWMKEGRQWSAFVRALVQKLLKIPPEQWPPGFDMLGKPIGDASETIRTGQPLIYTVSSLAPIVQAQQVLRDAATAISTFLETKGVKVGPPPADLPAQKGLTGGLTSLGGGLLAVALGVGALYLVTKKATE